MKAPLFAALALVSAAIVAQTPGDGQIAEPRPSAMSAGPSIPAAGSMQFEGTVLSASDRQLVVRTSDGRQLTLLVDHDTVGRGEFQANDRIRGSHRAVSGRGDVLSNVERIAAPAAPATTVTTASAPPQVETRVTTTVETTVPPEPTTSTGDVEDVSSDLSDDVSTLPATASPAPLVGLLGLLAAAGAGAVRRFRK